MFMLSDPVVKILPVQQFKSLLWLTGESIKVSFVKLISKPERGSFKVAKTTNLWGIYTKNSVMLKTVIYKRKKPISKLSLALSWLLRTVSNVRHQKKFHSLDMGYFEDGMTHTC